ncbi:histone-lysine N-methyltransferase [bacterium]|nr:histone-lysine N-methyltransferase [bacterium]
MNKLDHVGRSPFVGKPLYALQDVDEPNLFREHFTYRDVPRIPFDWHRVPMALPDDIFITDTTFRDGQQAREPFTAQQIVDLYRMLHRLGGRSGLIRQSEFFLYTQRDREALRKCRELGYKYPEVTGWIRANINDFTLVREAGLAETGILTSVSDYHIFNKMKKSRAEAMEDYLKIVRASIEADVLPRCHFEDVTRADIYGFVLPFAQRLRALADECRTKIKIRLCDTLGFGVPYAEAAIPRSVPKLVWLLHHEADFPSDWLEWHGHNDFHKVHINTMTAWMYGCAGGNATLLGIGERTGNSPLEALVVEYLALKGPDANIDTAAITDIAQYFERELGDRIPHNQPFVGSEFNVTRAGIHVDGVLKDEEIYNVFDTTHLLNRPVGVIIGDKSGAAGIAYWVNSCLKLTGDQAISKRHPAVEAIHRWVMQEYDNGRATSISNEELLEQARRHLPHLFRGELEQVRDRAIAEAEKILKWASENRKIISMNPDVIQPVIEKIVDENPFIQRMYVTDSNGVQITDNATDEPLRAAYERDHDVKGTDKSDRQWIRKTLQKPAVHVSDFYTSTITHKLCFSAGVPVLDYRDQLVGVIGADLNFEELAEDVDQSASPMPIGVPHPAGTPRRSMNARAARAKKA